MILSLVWGVPEAVVAQTVGGAILLKNDRMLVGKVESRGNLYSVVVADDSRVSIPVDQVRHVGRDAMDLYQFKVGSTKQWGIGDHFQMTRWCLLNGLFDQATEHYQEVAKIKADHPRVKQLGVELQKKLLEQPDFRNYLGLTPIATGGTGSARGNATSKDRDSVVTASATLDHTLMHPEIASRFSQRIQPILINRCSQAACHGVRSQNALQLMEPYDRVFARISSENLGSVMAQVSADPQQISPLLKYATTAHGVQRQPSISLTESQLLAELGSWIQQVQNPVVLAMGLDSGQAFVPTRQAARFVPFSPAVELVPVTPGSSNLRPVPQGDFPNGDMPTREEIDALNERAKKILGEQPATLNPAVSTRDPFDPEEFNKQTRR